MLDLIGPSVVVYLDFAIASTQNARTSATAYHYVHEGHPDSEEHDDRANSL
jgi:hypothetical protein